MYNNNRESATTEWNRGSGGGGWNASQQNAPNLSAAFFEDEYAGSPSAGFRIENPPPTSSTGGYYQYHHQQQQPQLQQQGFQQPYFDQSRRRQPNRPAARQKRATSSSTAAAETAPYYNNSNAIPLGSGLSDTYSQRSRGTGPAYQAQGFFRGGSTYQPGNEVRYEPAKPGGGRQQQNPASSSAYHCDICNVDCTGEQSYHAHLEGKKHKEKVNPSTKGQRQVNSHGGQKKTGQQTTGGKGSGHFYGNYEVRAESYTDVNYNNFSSSVQYSGDRDNYNKNGGSQNNQQAEQQNFYEDTVQDYYQGWRNMDYHQGSQQDQNQNENFVYDHENSGHGQAQGSYDNYDDYYDSYEGQYNAKERRQEKLERRTRTYYCDTCNMSCTGEQSWNAHLDGKTHKKKALLAGHEVQPVAQNKKKAAFHCQVCNVGCNAQEIFEAHISGQKHQKAIKVLIKANKPIPNMEYSMIPPLKAASEASMNTATTSSSGLPQEQNLNSQLGIVPPQVRNDRHIQEKVALIELSFEELKELEQLVLRVEDTLYAVSEFIEAERGTTQRLLRGIMRVGLLAKQLLLKSDKTVDLVVLCSVIPTSMLLYQIIELFRRFINQKEDDQYVYVADKIPASAICVSQIGISIDVYVTLTCSAMRQWSPGDLNYYPYVEPLNALPKSPCLNALAEMRRTKFYQVKCEQHESMNSVVKIIREIRTRVPAWGVLTDWVIELIVEKSLSVHRDFTIGPSTALKAVFDAISEGIVLGRGATLLDPCEKLPIDTIAGVNEKEREHIYSSCRYAIKQINTNKIVKLLALDGSPGIPSSEFPPKRKKARLAEDGNRHTETTTTAGTLVTEAFSSASQQPRQAEDAPMNPEDINTSTAPEGTNSSTSVPEGANTSALAPEGNSNEGTTTTATMSKDTNSSTSASSEGTNTTTSALGGTDNESSQGENADGSMAEETNKVPEEEATQAAEGSATGSCGDGTVEVEGVPEAMETTQQNEESVQQQNAAVEHTERIVVID